MNTLALTPPGGPEMLVVLAIVVLLFGGSKLPGLARSLGQAQREFRKGANDDAADDAPAGNDKPTS